MTDIEDWTQEQINEMSYIMMNAIMVEAPRKFFSMTDEFWEGYDKYWKKVREEEVREKEASAKQE